MATYREGGRLPVLSYLKTSTILVNGEETVVKVREAAEPNLSACIDTQLVYPWPGSTCNSHLHM